MLKSTLSFPNTSKNKKEIKSQKLLEVSQSKHPLRLIIRETILEIIDVRLNSDIFERIGGKVIVARQFLTDCLQEESIPLEGSSIC